MKPALWTGRKCSSLCLSRPARRVLVIHSFWKWERRADVRLPMPEDWTAETLQPLTDGLKRLFVSSRQARPRIPDDPQNRWGGKNRRNGRELTATVTKVSENYFRVTLTVESVSREPLTRPVAFYLPSLFLRRGPDGPGRCRGGNDHSSVARALQLASHGRRTLLSNSISPSSRTRRPNFANL